MNSSMSNFWVQVGVYVGGAGGLALLVGLILTQNSNRLLYTVAGVAVLAGICMMLLAHRYARRSDEPSRNKPSAFFRGKSKGNEFTDNATDADTFHEGSAENTKFRRNRQERPS